MNKKNVINKLCTVAIISCFAVAPVFAMEEIKYEKEIIKAVKQDKVENVTQEYLDNIDMLVFKQGYENQDFEKALKTADYRIKAKESFYGRNSIEVRNAYFSKAELALHAGVVDEAFTALHEVRKIVEVIKRDETLKEKALRIAEVIHSSFENTTKVANIISKTSDKQNQREIDKLLYLSQSGDVKFVFKELKKLENKAIKTKNNELLVNVYAAQLNLLCEVNDYKKMWAYVEKAEKMLTDFPQLKGTIDYVKVTYYKEMSQHEKAIEYLNANYKKDTYNDKLSYYGTLFDVQQDAKYYKDAYKTINKLESLYLEKYSENSLQLLKMVYDANLNLYQNTRNDELFNEYIEKYREIVEPIKDKAPILYAKYLEKLGNYQSHKKDYQNAKSTLLQAAKLYEEYEPKSHALAEIYKKISEVEDRNENLYEAIEYIVKAIEHNNKYYSDTSKNLADYYLHFSSLYSKSNDFEKGKIYLNKGLSIYRMIFGDNNVKTLQKSLFAYYFYKRNNKLGEVNDLLAKINKIVYSNEVVGYNKNFLYDIAITNATVAVENREKVEALDYLKEAQKYIDKTNKCQKKRIYHLKYNLYKESGNKIKALRYKKLAGIKD